MSSVEDVQVARSRQRDNIFPAPCVSDLLIFDFCPYLPSRDRPSSLNIPCGHDFYIAIEQCALDLQSLTVQSIEEVINDLLSALQLQAICQSTSVSATHNNNSNNNNWRDSQWFLYGLPLEILPSRYQSYRHI